MHAGKNFVCWPTKAQAELAIMAGSQYHEEIEPGKANGGEQ